MQQKENNDFQPTLITLFMCTVRLVDDFLFCFGCGCGCGNNELLLCGAIVKEKIK
jgi:hypothetical protein